MRVVDRGTKREVRWLKTRNASLRGESGRINESAIRSTSGVVETHLFSFCTVWRGTPMLANRLDAFRGSTSRERIIHRRGSYRGNIGKFVALSGFYLFPVQRFSSALATEFSDDFWLTASTNEKKEKEKTKCCKRVYVWRRRMKIGSVRMEQTIEYRRTDLSSSLKPTTSSVRF